jgi:diaminopimelate decarboxylase
MSELPFSEGLILELAETLPTPFHLYSEAGIRTDAHRLNNAFNWVEPNSEHIGYINYFAVKATPNPHILDILKAEGMGADTSSGPEVEIAHAVGLESPYIMFTSNNTPIEEYVEAYEAGAIINLDDINQIDVLQEALNGEFPDTISFRYNPGAKKTGGINDIIGEPEDSKFGIPDDQLEQAFRRAKELGVKHFGLHTMVASNELDPWQHIATARLVFEKVAELSQKLGIEFEFANLGGGLGIPYKPDENPIDLTVLREGVKRAYDEIIVGNGIAPLRVVTENGRYVTGPNAVLVTRVRSIKNIFHRIVGLDASMVNHPRPGMYDAYHEITVIGKRGGRLVMQRVVGGLCEDNDYFTGKTTKGRKLPRMRQGDVVVIHDTGAHSHAMGGNYNGKLKGPEYLWQIDGRVKQIRAAQTRASLYAELNYPGLSTDR